MGSCEKYSWQKPVLEDLSSEQSWRQHGAASLSRSSDLMKAGPLEDVGRVQRGLPEASSGPCSVIRDGGVGCFELIQSLSVKMINLV